MHLPQIFTVALLTLGTGIHLAKNGQPRTDKYSFGAALLGDLIIYGLLYWGGFFGH